MILFAVACLVFTLLGVIVLACTPSLTLTIENVGIFLIGAIPGAPAFGYLYGQVIANAGSEFKSPAAVVVAMLIGGTLSGMALVWGSGVGRHKHSQ